MVKIFGSVLLLLLSFSSYSLPIYDPQHLPITDKCAPLSGRMITFLSQLIVYPDHEDENKFYYKPFFRQLKPRDDGDVLFRIDRSRVDAYNSYAKLIEDDTLTNTIFNSEVIELLDKADIYIGEIEARELRNRFNRKILSGISRLVNEEAGYIRTRLSKTLSMRDASLLSMYQNRCNATLKLHPLPLESLIPYSLYKEKDTSGNSTIGLFYKRFYYNVVKSVIDVRFDLTTAGASNFLDEKPKILFPISAKAKAIFYEVGNLSLPVVKEFEMYSPACIDYDDEEGVYKLCTE